MELKFRYRFEAAHRFVDGSTRCSTPHGHTWYATLFFKVENPQLNSRQMLEDFSRLKSFWKDFIDQEVDHSFFYNENDPILPSLIKHIPGFRGIPFPGDPTTELIAALFLVRAKNLYRQSPLQPTGILIEETPTNSIFVESKDLESLLPASCPIPAWVTWEAQ